MAFRRVEHILGSRDLRRLTLRQASSSPLRQGLRERKASLQLRRGTDTDSREDMLS